MNATELSPDELIRSRAFFDAAEFAEIVEHADDEIVCEYQRGDVGCDAPATHACVCRNCRGITALICPAHASRLRHVYDVRTHLPCGNRGPLCEIAEAVPL